jgi:hypothetical protein
MASGRMLKSCMLAAPTVNTVHPSFERSQISSNIDECSTSSADIKLNNVDVKTQQNSSTG